LPFCDLVVARLTPAIGKAANVEDNGVENEDVGDGDEEVNAGLDPVEGGGVGVDIGDTPAATLAETHTVTLTEAAELTALLLSLLHYQHRLPESEIPPAVVLQRALVGRSLALLLEVQDLSLTALLPLLPVPSVPALSSAVPLSEQGEQEQEEQEENEIPAWSAPGVAIFLRNALRGNHLALSAFAGPFKTLFFNDPLGLFHRVLLLAMSVLYADLGECTDAGLESFTVCMAWLREIQITSPQLLLVTREGVGTLLTADSAVVALPLPLVCKVLIQLARLCESRPRSKDRNDGDGVKTSNTMLVLLSLHGAIGGIELVAACVLRDRASPFFPQLLKQQVVEADGLGIDTVDVLERFFRAFFCPYLTESDTSLLTSTTECLLASVSLHPLMPLNNDGHEQCLNPQQHSESLVPILDLFAFLTRRWRSSPRPAFVACVTPWMLHTVVPRLQTTIAGLKAHCKCSRIEGEGRGPPHAQASARLRRVANSLVLLLDLTNEGT
jgi:hypothetical protein